MKKYLIENSAEVYEDSYKDGEGDQIHSWQNSTQVIAATPIEAVKKFFDQKLCYSFVAENADFDDEDCNRVIYSNIVDENNCEATESELQAFKEGKKQLYAAYSDIRIFELVPASFEINKQKSETQQLTKTAEKLYLDFVNDFLTIEKFAEHYGLDIQAANAILDLGRLANEKPASFDYPQDGWQNLLDKENQELFDLFNNDLSAGLTFTNKDDLLFEIKRFKERDSDYCNWLCSSEVARDNNSLNEAFEALEKLESNLKA